MSDLDFARAQMGVSLAFHIVFAAIGVALPALMAIAEWRWLRTGDEVWRTLARRWAKGTAVLFAVGAVSGTVLSFELGLLWPRFMAMAGGVIGFPFALEGFAFFTEAIFLGIYLYGWERVSARAHFAAGVVVAASGAASAFFVTLANAWMNVPAGIDPVDPVAAMFSPTWPAEVLHVLLSSYVATAWIVAGIHAWRLRRAPGDAMHRRALGVALAVGGICALLQPLSGDLSARTAARFEPAKLASLEGQFATMAGAPLRIGGIPDPDAGVTRFALEIPHGLSLLAFHDPDATVRGLDEVPRADWPDVRSVHLCFQVMVGAGTLLAALSLALAFAAWRRRALPDAPRWLAAVAIASPLGMIALEAGWMVTERGRQPWIVGGVLRTADAVTPMPHLAASFAIVCAVYLLLGATVVAVMTREVSR